MPAIVVQRFQHMIRVSAARAAPPQQGQPAPSPPNDADTIKWLYDVLTILDSKAGALLAFDGLLLAAASLMYDKIAESVPTLKVPSLLLIIVSLVAALLCLLVARISYPFLGAIKLDQQNNQAEIDGLGQVVEDRTRLLARAWWMSVCAVGVFIFFVMLVVDVATN